MSPQATNLDVMKEQLVSLLDQGLHDSAEILGSILVSAAIASPDVQPSARSEYLILHGDALLAKQEYRRALNVFRQGQQMAKLTGVGRPSGARSPSGAKPLAGIGHQENEVSTRVKIAQCCEALQDLRPALNELEGIPPRLRTLRVNLQLARLYRLGGYDRAASAAYRDCLKQNPFAVEAVVALAQLGASAKEVNAFIVQDQAAGSGGGPQAPSKSHRSPAVDGHDSARWLSKFAEAHCALAGHNHSGALEHFRSLSQKFPDNFYLHLQCARAQAGQGRSDEAAISFHKAHVLDSGAVEGMDEYAMLLFQLRPHGPELGSITADLLAAQPRSPQAWTGSAIFWKGRGDLSRALLYADKAIRVDRRHALAYLVKGHVALQMERCDLALNSFRFAHSLQPELKSAQGMVRAALGAGKQKEALMAAREAHRALPGQAAALALLGDVYVAGGAASEKARRVYEAALRTDSTCVEAVLGLADVHIAEGQLDSATQLLQGHLAAGTSGAKQFLYCKLGHVLTSANQLDEALSHYQAALGINANNEEAIAGMDRLEKLMRGLDPDAPQADHLDAEDDGDDEADAELLP